ncbi:hypothetical protein [Borrelia turicatae]|uniref:hypothetical protein n=1 Tax=Borrelia turicatae TaxID=142 RepID=UPI002ED4D8FA
MKTIHIVVVFLVVLTFSCGVNGETTPSTQSINSSVFADDSLSKENVIHETTSVSQRTEGVDDADNQEAKVVAVVLNGNAVNGPKPEIDTGSQESSGDVSHDAVVASADVTSLITKSIGGNFLGGVFGTVADVIEEGIGIGTSLADQVVEGLFTIAFQGAKYFTSIGSASQSMDSSVSDGQETVSRAGSEVSISSGDSVDQKVQKDLSDIGFSELSVITSEKFSNNKYKLNKFFEWLNKHQEKKKALMDVMKKVDEKVKGNTQLVDGIFSDMENQITTLLDDDANTDLMSFVLEYFRFSNDRNGYSLILLLGGLLKIREYVGDKDFDTSDSNISDAVHQKAFNSIKDFFNTHPQDLEKPVVRSVR